MLLCLVGSYLFIRDRAVALDEHRSERTRARSGAEG
jgi:hypothetical protein